MDCRVAPHRHFTLSHMQLAPAQISIERSGNGRRAAPALRRGEGRAGTARRLSCIHARCNREQAATRGSQGRRWQRDFRNQAMQVSDIYIETDRMPAQIRSQRREAWKRRRV